MKEQAPYEANIDIALEMAYSEKPYRDVIREINLTQVDLQDPWGDDYTCWATDIVRDNALIDTVVTGRHAVMGLIALADNDDTYKRIVPDLNSTLALIRHEYWGAVDADIRDILALEADARGRAAQIMEFERRGEFETADNLQEIAHSLEESVRNAELESIARGQYDTAQRKIWGQLPQKQRYKAVQAFRKNIRQTRN